MLNLIDPIFQLLVGKIERHLKPQQLHIKGNWKKNKGKEEIRLVRK